MRNVPTPNAPARLLRIQEVAAETGLTTRAIRYYEEVGLLAPAARSDGDYRLFDESDLERLRFIRELREEAGFSLGQIGQLLEDEAARASNRARYRASDDPGERRAILAENRDRVVRQIETLRAKRDKLDAMLAEAAQRLRRIEGHIVELDAEDGHS
jgi:DNA-binding transcriptional MerR regulator